MVCLYIWYTVPAKSNKQLFLSGNVFLVSGSCIIIKKEDIIMLKVKTLQDRFGIWALSLAAAVALAVTSWNVNTCCWFILGQEKLPDNAKKLRRF